MDTVAQQIYAAAELLLQALRDPASNKGEQLNSTLNQFLTWPFRADSARITDTLGHNTTFDTVIHTTSGIQSADQPVTVNADAAACVVYVVGDLGADEIRTGYEKISTVKRLKRTCTPEIGFPISNTSLGIIFAVDSDLSIKNIAELMVRENSNHPSTEWPDMVAVLTKGTVNYVVQIHGDTVKGNFVLPSVKFPRIPPMYVHVFMRGLGLYSMNSMCGFLFMHLKTFSPGTNLPNMDVVLEGVLHLGMTFGAYQFNLQCELVPVPDELYLGQLFLPLPFRIEDSAGNLLSHLQAIPWQDGAALRVTGKLPLDAFLPFLGPVGLNAQIFKQSDSAISNILPIGKAEFRELLGRIQRQTNMTVKVEEPSLVFSKVSDEGTTSPFIARLSLGILRLRDVVFPDEKEREKFDKAYEFVFTTLSNARTDAKNIVEIITAHSHKVASGQIARLKGHVIHIDESIDLDLHSLVAEFLNSSVRVLKDSMQKLLVVLQLNIGCLYRKIGGFKTRIAVLKKTDPDLADYLQETRKWSERLISIRNDLHVGWMLPKFGYKENSGTIEVVEPQISGQSASEFANYMLN